MIFTEVVFVEKILISILITEFLEKLTCCIVADTRSQMGERGDESRMAGRMEYRKLPLHKVFPWTSYNRPKTVTDIAYKEEYTTRFVRIISVFKNYWILSMSAVDIYGNEFCTTYSTPIKLILFFCIIKLGGNISWRKCSKRNTRFYLNHIYDTFFRIWQSVLYDVFIIFLFTVLYAHIQATLRINWRTNIRYLHGL
jgi:hypothetical protein